MKIGNHIKTEDFMGYAFSAKVFYPTLPAPVIDILGGIHLKITNHLYNTIQAKLRLDVDLEWRRRHILYIK